METVSITGSDTLLINNRVITNLGDLDNSALTFPNDVAEVKVGKNGNAIYSLNEMGKMGEMVLRVLRGSPDDKYLNGLFALQQANFAAFILMTGELVKNVGDGLGNVNGDTYILSGGIFSKGVEAKSNSEGDTEQSISLWNLRFAKAARAIS